MKKEISQISLLPSHVEVYKFVKGFIDSRLYAPEINEIAEGVNLTGRQCFRLVNDLVELGVFSKMKNKRRGLKLERSLEEVLSAKK